MGHHRVESHLAQLNETEFALGALTRVLPAKLVADVLAGAGKVAKRACKLPPELVTWLVVAMGIFRDLSIPNVLERVAAQLGNVRWGPAELPHGTTIAEARDRLGWSVLRTIFARLTAALVKEHEPATLWRGFALSALDGTTFRVPDSPANEKAFGRPGASRGDAKSGFPQMRAVLILGTFTHIITHAVFAPYCESELKTAARLANELKRGTLLLMDRLYYSFAWLATLSSRRIAFLVRAKTGERALKPKTIRRLADGSVLAKLLVPPSLKKKNRTLPDAIDVRVIKYRAAGFRPLTVVTSLLSPELYPAAEIGALYHERWEIELGCREFKTHQAKTQVTFRTKTPDRVRQEAYGLLIAYNCVRGLMAEAAAQKGLQPRRLSFVACLERIRAAVIAFDGGDADRFFERLLVSLACCVLPPRRVGRRCPRAVKIKMSKWPRKRPGSKVVARSRSAR